MNISSRCEYACRAMVELALHVDSDTPMKSMIIAERRRIPEKYLVQILLQLKRVGLVRSVRGAQGGYFLGRDADEITLLDIIVAVDGAILDPLPVDPQASPSWRAIWRDVAMRLEGQLAKVGLTDMIAREQA